MMFPLSPVSASVTFRSRISEPILRSCIREMHMEGDRNEQMLQCTSSASGPITLSPKMQASNTDFYADGVGDILACYQLLCKTTGLLVSIITHKQLCHYYFIKAQRHLRVIVPYWWIVIHISEDHSDHHCALQTK